MGTGADALAPATTAALIKNGNGVNNTPSARSGPTKSAAATGAGGKRPHPATDIGDPSPKRRRGKKNAAHPTATVSVKEGGGGAGGVTKDKDDGDDGGYKSEELCERFGKDGGFGGFDGVGRGVKAEMVEEEEMLED